jgi:hypothetical protein
MSRNVTLLELRESIVYQTDNAGATARHAPTLVNRLINQSVQRFRERLSDEGATHFLASTTGTLGVGATSPYPGYVLDLTAVSPSVVRIHGVDITVSGEVRSLQHVPFTERNSYGGGVSKGIPVAWAPFNTAKVMILPPSGSAYAYCVWYLPVLADLSADSSTWDGVAGWEEFVKWDVSCQLIVRDQYPTAYSMAVDYKKEVWADILRAATKVTSAGGATIGRDSFGERLAGLPRKQPPPPPWG